MSFTADDARMITDEAIGKRQAARLALEEEKRRREAHAMQERQAEMDRVFPLMLDQFIVHIQAQAEEGLTHYSMVFSQVLNPYMLFWEELPDEIDIKTTGLDKSEDTLALIRRLVEDLLNRDFKVTFSVTRTGRFQENKELFDFVLRVNW
jgi:hypothetical protein